MYSARACWYIAIYLFRLFKNSVSNSVYVSYSRSHGWDLNWDRSKNITYLILMFGLSTVSVDVFYLPWLSFIISFVTIIVTAVTLILAAACCLYVCMQKHSWFKHTTRQEKTCNTTTNTKVWWGYASYIRRKNNARTVSTEQFSKTPYDDQWRSKHVGDIVVFKMSLKDA
jgi:hypothetical protein